MLHLLSGKARASCYSGIGSDADQFDLKNRHETQTEKLLRIYAPASLKPHNTEKRIGTGKLIKEQPQELAYAAESSELSSSEIPGLKSKVEPCGALLISGLGLDIESRS